MESSHAEQHETNDSSFLSANGMMGNDETDQLDASPSLPQHVADPLSMMGRAPDDPFSESGILGMAGISSSDMNATMTASHSSLLHLSTSEPSLKPLDQEAFMSQTSLSQMDTDAPFIKAEETAALPEASHPPAAVAVTQDIETEKPVAKLPSNSDEGTGIVSPDEGTTLASQADSSNPSLSDVPFKATTFKHLCQKYLGELEYMLREFQKLERQLLGAKTVQSVESAGSRERREKLHSFILHLADTITQIRTGRELEAAGQSTIAGSLENTSLAKPTQAKEEEENVQKLEEHILANLLPVKVRLKKQLAAQQGAKHNPAGMPVRGVVADPSKANGKAGGGGTFMAAAARRPSQFGKPLAGEGSSLTQKLHGQTLGSETRTHGDGVGSTPQKEEANLDDKKILFAGMALGSRQMKSSLTAASTAHRVVVDDPELLVRSSRKRSRELISQEAPGESSTESEKPPPLQAEETVAPQRQRQKRSEPATASTAVPVRALSTPANNATTALSTRAAPATKAATAIKTTTTLGPAQDKVVASTSAMTAEERRKLRKKRRKKKRLQREQKKKSKLQSLGKRKKNAGGASKQLGPRGVEYMCALCNEVYNYTCEYNPWWALSQHECPKCRKTQLPRVDISAPANAIEYHPALLAHADDNAGGGGANAVLQMRASPAKQPPPAPPKEEEVDDSDSDDSDLSDSDLSDDSFSDESDPEILASMSPGEKAERERFGDEYDGPKLSDKQASRLLPLMLHASTCPCRHTSPQHRDVCRSMKWMMMHVRDCPGTTATFDVCPFPWCRKIKHLLYHLVTCKEPGACPICSSDELSGHLVALRGLNDFRLEKRKAAIAKKIKPQAKAKSTAVGRQSKAPASFKNAKAKQQAQCRSVTKTPVTQPAKPATVVAASTDPKALSVAKPSATTAVLPLPSKTVAAPKVSVPKAALHTGDRSPVSSVHPRPSAPAAPLSSTNKGTTVNTGVQSSAPLAAPGTTTYLAAPSQRKVAATPGVVPSTKASSAVQLVSAAVPTNSHVTAVAVSPTSKSDSSNPDAATSSASSALVPKTDKPAGVKANTGIPSASVQGALSVPSAVASPTSHTAGRASTSSGTAVLAVTKTTVSTGNFPVVETPVVAPMASAPIATEPKVTTPPIATTSTAANTAPVLAPPTDGVGAKVVISNSAPTAEAVLAANVATTKIVVGAVTTPVVPVKVEATNDLDAKNGTLLDRPADAQQASQQGNAEGPCNISSITKEGGEKKPGGAGQVSVS